jgi:hypothetical protein
VVALGEQNGQATAEAGVVAATPTANANARIEKREIMAREPP